MNIKESMIILFNSFIIIFLIFICILGILLFGKLLHNECYLSKTGYLICDYQGDNLEKEVDANE